MGARILNFSGVDSDCSLFDLSVAGGAGREIFCWTSSLVPGPVWLGVALSAGWFEALLCLLPGQGVESKLRGLKGGNKNLLISVGTKGGWQCLMTVGWTMKPIREFNVEKRITLLE